MAIKILEGNNINVLESQIDKFTADNKKEVIQISICAGETTGEFFKNTPKCVLVY